MSNAFNIKRTATNGDGVSLNSVAHPRPTSKIDVIIDALSVAQNSVWSALNQEALAYAIELKLELAKPDQRPVAWLHPDKKVDVIAPTILEWFDKPVPLYTAPPRKEWVGLTNDEINDFSAGCHLGKSVQNAICQAAAKLKELNT
jgi:hypothetical protein